MLSGHGCVGAWRLQGGLALQEKVATQAPGIRYDSAPDLSPLLRDPLLSRLFPDTRVCTFCTAAPERVRVREGLQTRFGEEKHSHRADRRPLQAPVLPLWAVFVTWARSRTPCGPAALRTPFHSQTPHLSQGPGSLCFPPPFWAQRPRSSLQPRS